MALEPAARAELSRSFLARSCSAIPSLPSLLNPPRLQAGRGSRPHRFGREGAEGQREPCPVRFQRAKNPPFAGGSRFSLEAGRQVTDDDIDPVGRSRRSVGHTGGGRYVLAAAACATAFIWVQLHSPAGSFESSASALLHALRSPVREAAVSSLLAIECTI